MVSLDFEVTSRRFSDGKFCYVTIKITICRWKIVLNFLNFRLPVPNAPDISIFSSV